MELGAAPIWRKQQNTSNHIAMKYKAIATLATTVRYSNCNKCEIQQRAILCNKWDVQHLQQMWDTAIATKLRYSNVQLFATFVRYSKQWRWLPALPIELVMAISCFAGLALPTPPVLRSLVYFCQGGRTYIQTHMKSFTYNERDDLIYEVSYKQQPTFIQMFENQNSKTMH